MITQESTIKIGVPVGVIFAAIAWAGTWAMDNIAMKSDIQPLREYNVEIMIQLTELQIRPLEESEDRTDSQDREYDQLKGRLNRLIKERERLLTL